MNELIKKISNISQSYDVYVVGGFVRDLFLKRHNEDIDLAVNRDSLKYSKMLAKVLGAKVITLDKVTKTYRIILYNNHIKNIDVALLSLCTIEKDLHNRDFAINAIAFNIKYFKNFKKHIIFVNSSTLKDLKTKTLNIVSSKSFKIDPLRILRGFRFMAEQGYTLSKTSLKQVKIDAKLISTISKERVKDELSRIFASKSTSKVLEIMDKTGVLSVVLPECSVMKKTVKKYYYHKGGLFEHSFLSLKASESILDNLKKYFPKNYIDIEKHFQESSTFSQYITRKGLLKFAILFHDNAKPETSSLKNGKKHFFGHEEQGAKKIKKMMLDLKFSKKDIEYAAFLVRHHMRPSTLTRNSIVTKKASLKFFRDIGDLVLDLLIVSMADWHSYKNLKIFSKKDLKLQEQSVMYLAQYYYDLKHVKPIKKIIDGNIIMKEFFLKPGPIIGKLLEVATLAYEEGKALTLNEILKIVSLELTQIKKKYRI